MSINGNEQFAMATEMAQGSAIVIIHHLNDESPREQPRS